MLFDFSIVKSREKTKSLEREHEIICFMFCNIFFHKNTVGADEAPSSLLQKEKRGSAKSDVSKVLFPDIMKNNMHQTCFTATIVAFGFNIINGRYMFRSSRPEVFSKKLFFKIFTGKHLCQSLFCNKDSATGVFLRILQNF